MEKVATKETFYLAYCKAYPCDNILKIAEGLNYQQTQEIMVQGLADYLGQMTQEDKAFFGFFSGDGEKTPSSLDDSLLDAHGRLEEMVSKDYISKLSMEEAITLIWLLRRNPYASFMLGGLDGVTLDAEYIVSRWSNTHWDARKEFMKKLEGK